MLFTTIITSSSAIAQSLKLHDIWHYQKGDIPQDSLTKILQRNSLNLKYNEIITLQFKGQTPDNQILNYHFRIPNTEKYDKCIELGHEPIVQIPPLDGDEYRLEITTNPKTNKADISFPIIIKRSFWQELWFSGGDCLRDIFDWHWRIFFHVIQPSSKIKTPRCPQPNCGRFAR